MALAQSAASMPGASLTQKEKSATGDTLDRASRVTIVTLFIPKICGIVDAMETDQPQLPDEAPTGTIVVLPSFGGSMTTIWQARRTIDGWELMPTVLIGMQLSEVTPEDWVKNFDEAYLDNPERMYRFPVPDSSGKLRGAIDEVLMIGAELERMGSGWMVRNLDPRDVQERVKG